jgi:DNA-binding LacI/PurR family transcriptional regulator
MLEMRKQGRLMLPSERELCKTLECSRNNLRQVLDDYEQKGDIVKRLRGRALSMGKATGKKLLGCFAFVAAGENMIGNPAWSKLWMRLQPIAEAADLAPELELLGYHDKSAELLQKVIDAPEVIVFADSPNYELTSKITSLPNKKIILLDEQNAVSNQSLVSIDNYAAGFMAAKELATHNYRHPLCLCHNLLIGGKLYNMYEQRLNGFRAGCRKYDLEFDEKSEFIIGGNATQFLIRLVKFVETLNISNFDSIFLYSDNLMQFFYEALLEEGLSAPNNIGLITVNSFDNAISLHPKISSISHATHGVAAKLTEELCKFFSNDNYTIGQNFIKPTVHQGETLRKKN